MNQPKEHVHALACWFASQAANMVFLQSRRLWGADADHQSAKYDFWFLLMAAHQLRKAAVQVERYAKNGAPIVQAIKNFDECIPDLAMARNIFMHFDEYIAGKGQQRDGAVIAGISPSSLSLFEFRYSTRTIIWSPTKAILGSSEGGFRIDQAKLESCTQKIRDVVIASEASNEDS